MPQVRFRMPDGQILASHSVDYRPVRTRRTADGVVGGDGPGGRVLSGSLHRGNLSRPPEMSLLPPRGRRHGRSGSVEPGRGPVGREFRSVRWSRASPDRACSMKRFDPARCPQVIHCRKPRWTWYGAGSIRVPSGRQRTRMRPRPEQRSPEPLWWSLQPGASPGRSRGEAGGVGSKTHRRLHPGGSGGTGVGAFSAGVPGRC